MRYQRKGRQIVCRLEKGEEICEALLDLQSRENIGTARISGIGATNDCTVGVFEIARGAYDPVHLTGDMEITSLAGNLTRMNGKPYAHLHINCAGTGGVVYGGHLLKGTVSLTAEIFITIIDITVERLHNDELGINLMDI